MIIEQYYNCFYYELSQLLITKNEEIFVRVRNDIIEKGTNNRMYFFDEAQKCNHVNTSFIYKFNQRMTPCNRITAQINLLLPAYYSPSLFKRHDSNPPKNSIQVITEEHRCKLMHNTRKNSRVHLMKLALAYRSQCIHN